MKPEPRPRVTIAIFVTALALIDAHLGHAAELGMEKVRIAVLRERR
jgi:hypothetical protein